MWLLLVGLTSALEETDFVLQDEHVSKPALLELFLIQLVFLTSMEWRSEEMPSITTGIESE